MADLEARLPESVLPAVTAQLARALQAEVDRRVRDGDATLWGPPGTAEIADRLGWLTVAERVLEQADQLTSFAAAAREEGFEDVVLLGMGGSSLAAEVIRSNFSGARAGWPRLHVLDTTDPEAIGRVGRRIEPHRSLFLVSSKSGGTIEPLSLLAHFWSELPDGAHFVAITDPGTGLARLARERGFRHVFEGDPEIGGRYSALSVFGMVPAALMGVDVRGLLEGSRSAFTTQIAWENGEQPAASWLGAALSALAQAGRDKLTFIVSDDLPDLGLWLEQLVAESTGKQGRGILPVAGEPLGLPSEYGDDRVFVHLPVSGVDEREATERASALATAGHPLITMPTSGPTDLGRIFLLWELAVAVAGWGLQINPFDQPNVQQAKDATNRVLASYEAERAWPAVEDAGERAIRDLLEDGCPPEYVALMAYLEPSSEFDRAVADLREAIRKRRTTTTTFGYGPRFLHSTGQFHKGGPREGRFLQLLYDGPEDIEIPGEPYTFGQLKNAQALGDLQTLRGLSLPAQRLHLHGPSPARAVQALTELVRAGGGGSSR